MMLGGQPTWRSRIKNLGSKYYPSKPWGKVAQPSGSPAWLCRCCPLGADPRTPGPGLPCLLQLPGDLSRWLAVSVLHLHHCPTVKTAEPAWGDPRLEVGGSRLDLRGRSPGTQGPSGTPYPQFCSVSRSTFHRVSSPWEQPLTLESTGCQAQPVPWALQAVGVGAEFGESLGAQAGCGWAQQLWPFLWGPH